MNPRPWLAIPVVVRAAAGRLRRCQRRLIPDILAGDSKLEKPVADEKGATPDIGPHNLAPTAFIVCVFSSLFELVRQFMRWAQIGYVSERVPKDQRTQAIGFSVTLAGTIRLNPLCAVKSPVPNGGRRPPGGGNSAGDAALRRPEVG